MATELPIQQQIEQSREALAQQEAARSQLEAQKAKILRLEAPGTSAEFVARQNALRNINAQLGQIQGTVSGFETSVAQGAPQYALPEYRQRAYEIARTEIQTKINEQQQIINSLEAAKARQQEMLGENVGNPAGIQGIYETIRQINNEINQARATQSAYSSQLGQSPEQVIQSYYSGYADRFASYSSQLASSGEQYGVMSQVNGEWVYKSSPQYKDYLAQLQQPTISGGADVSPSVYATLLQAAEQGVTGAKEALAKVGGLYITPLTLSTYQREVASKLPSGEKPIFDKSGLNVVGIESSILQKSLSPEAYQTAITAEYRKQALAQGIDPDTGKIIGVVTATKSPTQRLIENIKADYTPYGIVQAGYEFAREEATKLSQIGTKGYGESGAYGVLGGVALGVTDLIYGASLPVQFILNPIETSKQLGGFIGETTKKIFTTGLPEISQILVEKPGFSFGYLAGTAAGAELAKVPLTKFGEVISPTIEKIGSSKIADYIKSSEAFETISGYAKNIKGSPVFKAIAYEESALPKLSEYFKIFKEEPGVLVEGVIKPRTGYELFMSEEVKLGKTPTERLQVGVAAQANIQDLVKRYESMGIEVFPERTMPTFSTGEKGAIQMSIFKEAVSPDINVAGSTALVLEPYFMQTYKMLYGEPRVPGDIELALRGYSPKMKSTSLTTEETPISLKAKSELAGRNIYENLINVPEALKQEREFLSAGLNKNIDLSLLPELSEQQAFVLENAPGKIKGSAVRKLIIEAKKQGAGTIIEQIEQAGITSPFEQPKFMIKEKPSKLSEAEKSYEISFEGDIDIKAANRLSEYFKSKEFLKRFEEKFPGQLTSAQQMRIKAVGIKQAELGELTDYKVGTEAKPPIGSIIEPTGKVYQIGEAVKIKMQEILDVPIKEVIIETQTPFDVLKGYEGFMEKPEIALKIKKLQEAQVRTVPQLKGGNINISLKRIFAGGEEPLADIAVELDKGMNLRYKKTPGKEITFTTTSGKQFTVVKRLYQTFENQDRVVNALTFEQVSKGTKHLAQDIKEGFYILDKKIGVSTEGGKAFGAELALKYGPEYKQLTLTKEGVRSVLSLAPETLPEDLSLVKLEKVAEVFSQKDFPPLVYEKPALVQGKYYVQGRFASRVGKQVAESVRGEYPNVPLELDKDFKDLTASKVADIRALSEAAEKVPYSEQIIETQTPFDVLRGYQEFMNRPEIKLTSRQRFYGQINKAIEQFYQSEGRAPITSNADLTRRYIENIISPRRADKIIKYEPIRTQAELEAARAIKVSLKEKEYTPERLSNILSSKLGQETSMASYKEIYPKAEKILQEQISGKSKLSKVQAETAINKVFSSIDKDIRASAPSAQQLKAQIETYVKLQGKKQQYPYLGYSGKAYPSYTAYSKYQKYPEYKYTAYTEPAYTSYTAYPEKIITSAPYTPYQPAPYKPAPYTSYFTEPYIYQGYTPYKPQEPLIPRTPIKPPILFKEEKKKKQARKLQAAYAVLLKKRGKFSTVATGLTRAKALRFGEDIALKDIARTFKIAPTGQMKEMFGIEEQYLPSPKFRGYKVRSGKAIPLSDTFIQKTSANLQSIQEKRQLAEARRLNKLMGVNF